jgi:hypothetical protein
MEHRTSVTYSGPAQAEAIKLYWSRMIGVATPITVCALVAMLIWHLFRGDRSWIMAVEAGVVVLVAAWACAVYFGHIRRIQRWSREFADLQVEVLADESALSLVLPNDTALFRWSDKLELSQLKEVWLVVGPKGDWAAIPAASLSEAMKQFIISRVREGVASVPSNKSLERTREG